MTEGSPAAPDPQLVAAITTWARELGFQQVGIADLDLHIHLLDEDRIAVGLHTHGKANDPEELAKVLGVSGGLLAGLSIGRQGPSVQVAAGVPLSSYGRKLAFALRFGSINILLSSDLTDSTRIIFNQQVRQRAQHRAGQHGSVSGVDGQEIHQSSMPRWAGMPA